MSIVSVRIGDGFWQAAEIPADLMVLEVGDFIRLSEGTYRVGEMSFQMSHDFAGWPHVWLTVYPDRITLRPGRRPSITYSGNSG
jgi:hypothetical protein